MKRAAAPDAAPVAAVVPPLTRALAEFVVRHPARGWDDACEQAGLRTILNWLGCAIGAADHPAVHAAVTAMQDLDPAPRATIYGRNERMDLASAALVNGIASHVFDYDDTHPGNLVHPAGPVVSCALAVAERHGCSGREVVDAVVIGVDVSCRMANLVCPEHYDRGWHVTGSAGVLGAAAACARLLKLDATQAAMALGLAASQPIGLREQFGSMAKPFHPGAAARAGLTAALLARRGFTASATTLEGTRGYARVLSDRQHWDAPLAGLGQRFEITSNTFKPYACGLVIHPCIDGCLQLRQQHGLRPSDVAQVQLRVHPLVLELTGKTEPRTGLEGKFSVFHACAAALVLGWAGEAEFQPSVVLRPDVVDLRRRISAEADHSIRHEAAYVEITCHDGRRLQHHVRAALGSLERPMGDVELDLKFDGLVVPVLGADRAAALRRACRTLASAPDLQQLSALARPSGVAGGNQLDQETQT
jgi:2-methylcitrate dehydratase PrpD